MSKLESTILSLYSLSRPIARTGNETALLLQTVVYLIAVLGVPLYEPQKIIWLAIYPVIQSEMSGIGYARVLLKSLWVLPLIALIGIFNPLMDPAPAFSIGNIVVSRGWVTFFSIILRGLFAVQAAYLLTVMAGFYNMCDALRKVGCPKILVTQIQFTYRYLTVIAEEALGMDRARKARGFGEKSYPLKEWGRIVGQLLIRSYERSTRINRAMIARGFEGTMPTPQSNKYKLKSWFPAIIWIAIIIAIRFINFDFSSIL